MGLKSLEDVTYFRLNNEINRPVNGQIMLHKDKEALDAFFKENVVPNTKAFDSITDKIQYLLEHNYIERAFIEKYRPEFLEELAQFIKDQNFQFKSFMAAYKFYNQYALKTNDGEYYLESMEDRVFFNALYFADGNEAIARDIANEIIHQRYQPATPSFLNAGRARRGELVSCFLIQVTDDMNAIGRSINSALQLSRIGGGVGISLSNLREAGAPIKGYEGAASGVVPVIEFQKKILQEAGCSAEVIAFLDEIEDEVFCEYYCFCFLDGMPIEEVRRIDSVPVQNWKDKIKCIREERTGYLERLFVPDAQVTQQISKLHEKAGRVFKETEELRDTINTTLKQTLKIQEEALVQQKESYQSTLASKAELLKDREDKIQSLLSEIEQNKAVWENEKKDLLLKLEDEPLGAGYDPKAGYGALRQL